MTKLEFLDKINDILVGLNTLESDLLGSLYDELMRDAGWHPASELPPLDEDGESETVIGYYFEQYNGITLPNCAFVSYDKEEGWTIPNIKWWCYPPKEGGDE